MAAESLDILEPAAVARLESLEIIARELVMGFLKGPHLSARKGSSTEFAEHRAYAPGDDIRHIDWKTFGKTDRFFVKEYDDETNTRATLVVDASGSMAFGSAGVTKLRYASCLAASAGYLLVAQRDAVGLALAGERVRRYVPPKATPRHLRGILGEIEAATAIGETRLGSCIHAVAERVDERSLVLVFSDFLDDPRAVLRGVADLRHRGCEALLFHVVDPAEEEFPFKTWCVFQDPESPSRRVRVDARIVREMYLESLAEHLKVLRDGCAAMGADHALVRTTTRFDVGLAAVLDARSRRSR